MNGFLVYNGRFYNSSKKLFGANNRGLRYGDGLFETIRVSKGNIQFSSWHWDRLFTGLRLLGFESPAFFTKEYLHKQVLDLCKKNNTANARVRVTIVRGDGGLYDPENHIPNFLIQSWPLPTPAFDINSNGLVTGIYENARKSMDSFSNIKWNNHLPYAMAALHSQQQKWNEVFILNANNNICDASIANVFTVSNGRIFTPPLSEGCIAGVLRRFLVENLPKHGFELVEAPLTREALLNANEIFVTNSIRGIRWVQSCGQHIYKNDLAMNVYQKMLKIMD